MARCGLLFTVAVVSVLPGTAALADMYLSGLLGNTLDLPLIAYGSPGVMTYDADTDIFSVDASPLTIEVEGYAPVNISYPESFVINVTVDATGALTGGVAGDDLVVTGNAAVPGMGFLFGVLLTGEVTGFGYEDSGGTTDYFDFTFTVTGGMLAPHYPQTIGVTLNSAQSNFSGVFAVNFDGEANGTLGAVIQPVPPDTTQDVASAALGDRVWEDLNANGIQDCSDSNGNGILGDVNPLEPFNPAISDQGPECGDTSSGGAGIAGVPVNLFQPDGSGNCTIDLGMQVVTGRDGFYQFPDLAPGDYCVVFGLPSGDFCDTDGIALGLPQFTALNAGGDTAADSDADPVDGRTDALTLGAGETNRTLNAGIVCPAMIGDRVWEDTNQDGMQDGAESGVEGVTARLFKCGPDGIAGTADDVDTGQSRVTDAIDGMYMFGAEAEVSGLEPGDYYVQFDPATIPAGYDFTLPKAGPDDSIDSDCLPANGITACTTLGSRGINMSRDCGVSAPTTLSCDLQLDKRCRMGGAQDDDGEFTESCSFTLPQIPSCDVLKEAQQTLTSLTFKYTGGGCDQSSNGQGRKSKCKTTPAASTVSGTVTVRAAGKKKFHKEKHMYMVDSTLVDPDGTFEISADKFRHAAYIEIADGSGVVELNELHTSCSKPLAVGNVFGSLTLVAINGNDGGVDVSYQYVVTNNGDPLTDILMSDVPLGDIGGPVDLGSGESQTFTAQAHLVSTTANTATASGFLASGEACSAADTVVVEAVEPLPQAAECRELRPIDALVLEYDASQAGGRSIEEVSWYRHKFDAHKPTKNLISTVGPVSDGQVVNFDGFAAAKAGNNVEFFIRFADGSSAISRFHRSCSDQDMNDISDCGALLGDGKNSDTGLNTWRLRDLVGSNGKVLGCQ